MRVSAVIYHNTQKHNKQKKHKFGGFIAHRDFFQTTISGEDYFMEEKNSGFITFLKNKR